MSDNVSPLSVESEIGSIYDLLDDCMQADRVQFKKRLHGIKQRLRQRKPVDKSLSQLRTDIEVSSHRLLARKQSVPQIVYPDELPIVSRREDILKALSEHQVIIVAGETGSGKTTQLPKLCLEAGRGINAMIGHTQPRRIAARTVADRIAQELHTPLGDKVGYQVRFTDHASENTYIKLMTDGILLAEIQHDRFLNRYDTIIIDEAHERSLNIDFLLGYLKQLLPKRPDLKVIITSATIDVERFSQHFDNAPVIEVSGRTYPVEILYRPPLEADEDIYTAINSAVDEIMAMPTRGDILVFLSGEREIRETANLLRHARLKDVEILPLYARLNLKEQGRIFQPHRGVRIILATNVAETSITVPGVRYVIDTGYARISRYSYRTKVQRLPVEAISQASANQRAGRCGRVSDGVCFRLYSEEDFQGRPEFTDAEILRTNLAAVILQMLQMRIGDVREFPFVDAPDSRLINDGFQLLSELGAVTPKGELTTIGRQLSGLPVDPRLGRMLVSASQEGCLSEVLIITAVLSIQDPRERPVEKRQAADEKHRAWLDKDSDFISLLNLWNHFEEQRQLLSRNKFSAYCHSQYVSYLRMREWRDLEHQLRLACKNQGLTFNRQAAGPDRVHRAILSGLLSHVGFCHDGKEYQGARNRKFHLFPGSGLFKKPPKWVMAAELIETSRLYAHTVAAINPDWLAELAVHLVRKHHSEPYYDRRRGQVMALERQTLFGLTILDGKRVGFAGIDPKLSREIFIRSALVEEGYRGKGPFYRHNRQLLLELEDMENRLRQRDIVISDETIFRFYDERVPPEIHSLAAFEHWRKSTEKEKPRLLYFDRNGLLEQLNLSEAVSQFPGHIEWQGVSYKTTYRFEPGHEADGVSIHIPMPILHQTPSHLFEWLVPGLLREKCVALVKALPKQWRKLFVPVPDYVDKALPGMSPGNRPLSEALGEQLQRHTGLKVPGEAWQENQLDDFYQVTYCLEDEQGKVLALSKELDKLKQQYRDTIQSVIHEAAGEAVEQGGLSRWTFGSLKEKEILKKGKLDIQSYPALVDDGDTVSLRLLDSGDVARRQTLEGVVKLLMLTYPDAAKYLRKQLLKGNALQLVAAKLTEKGLLIEDIIRAAYKSACLEGKPIPRTEEAFAAVLQEGKAKIIGEAQSLEATIIQLLEPLAEVRKLLARHEKQYPKHCKQIADNLGRLFREDFVFATGTFWLHQYPRYLKALCMRLEKLPAQPAKDLAFCEDIENSRHNLEMLLSTKNVIPAEVEPEIEKYRFMLEEYSVSTFAQVLKTPLPVSPKRIKAQLDAITRMIP